MSKDNDAIGELHIGHIEIDTNLYNKAIDSDCLPILPTRNLVLFPGVSLPISLTRENTLRIAKEASEKHFPVGIVCQLDPDNDHPHSIDDLYRYGVAADVFQVMELPDGSHTAIIRARQRIRLVNDNAEGPIKDAICASVKVLRDTVPSKKNIEEFENVMNNVTEVSTSISERNSGGEKAFSNAIRSISNLFDRLNFIATNVPAEPAEKIPLLQKGALLSRAMELLSLLLVIQDRYKVFDDIMSKAKMRMNESQRNAFLQSQLDAIKEELYGTIDDGDDIEKLSARLEESKMPADIREKARNEIAKLRRYNPSSPDYSVQYNYVDTLLGMPWSPTRTTDDIRRAREVLEADHYGLKGVKQRILEQIAVMINNPGVKAPILCLVGPPGVGKTSLGHSVANALGRVYERVALGGVHDETEVRGHRRTYIGAMPGRIVKALQSAGCTNPVLLLDEIDKLGKSMHGDPGAALLEVLDPEQNSTFHDNFLEVPYDLSKVFFIATANTLSSVPTPLLDRMEIIDIPAYTVDEKVQIARHHLLPKIFRNNGLPADGEGFTITNEAIEHIISGFTGREAGVRQLEKVLGSLVRKKILAKLCGDNYPEPVQPADVDTLLGDGARRTFGRVGFSAPVR